MTDVDELVRALEHPWERWTVFLHPAQRDLVERRFGGPARIAGSAGTGKTVVALHRAAHLARTNPDARILLTTFSGTLANSLRTKLARLISAEPRLRERIDVDALDTVARRLHDLLLGCANIASRDLARDLVRDAAREGEEHKFALPFLTSEWREVVDAWQISLRCSARSWPAGRLVLRRRPRPADLLTAFLVALAGRGHRRPVFHPADQLPDVTPDPGPSGPAAGEAGLRRGWDHRGAKRNDLGLQRAKADRSCAREVYDTERHFLYVACTRARDHLLVTGVHPASEFLEDLGG